jgi:hypothetical protein
MLFKLLRTNFNFYQALGASLGAIIGLVILLTSIQFYFDLAPMLKKNSNLWKPENLVINKKVSTTSSNILGKRPVFKDKELRDIESQPYVKKLGHFVPNTFKMSSKGQKGTLLENLRTELFFEAIPNDFLEYVKEDWDWQPGDTAVPIILPRDFLTLYNFAFAQSQGSPLLSDETAKELVKFYIKIRVPEDADKPPTNDEYYGYIYDFTDQVSTMIVPWNFLNWANKKYGRDDDPQPSRIIIEVENVADPDLYQYLEAKNYEVSRSKMKSGKLANLLKTLSSIIAAIGVIITGLALWLMIVSFQLMIQKNREKTENLYLIGYSLPRLVRFYAGYFLIISIILTIFSVFLTIAFKGFYVPMLQKGGIDVSQGLDGMTLVICVILVALLNGVNYLLLRQQIKNIVPGK